jgi:hypothetical protein
VTRDPGPLVRAEHCWVMDVQVWGDTPHPGLLLEWRQRPDGEWEGLVIAVQATPQDRGFDVRQRWVDASKIRPVD